MRVLSLGATFLGLVNSFTERDVAKEVLRGGPGPPP